MPVEFPSLPPDGLRDPDDAPRFDSLARRPGYPPAFLGALWVLGGLTGSAGYLAFGAVSHPLVTGVVVAVGLVVVAVGFLLPGAVREQQKPLDDLIAGRTVIAAWTCPDADWVRVTRPLLDERVRPLAKWIVVINVFAVGVLTWVRSPWPGIAMGVIVVNALAALTVWERWSLSRARQVRVLIGPSGVLMAGRYYPWAGGGRSLKEVCVQAGLPFVLKITIERIRLTRSHRSWVHEVKRQVVLIPVPHGLERDAERATCRLQGRNPTGAWSPSPGRSPWMASTSTR